MKSIDCDIMFEIQGLPKIITNGSKGSWKSAWAESRKWHRLVLQAIILGGHQIDQPYQTAALKLTRVSSNEPDFDGLCGSFKHVVDGLVKAGILANDKISNIGQPIYDWKKCKRNEGKIKVEIVGNK